VLGGWGGEVKPETKELRANVLNTNRKWLKENNRKKGHNFNLLGSRPWSVSVGRKALK
jgi:hypothetical protein